MPLAGGPPPTANSGNFTPTATGTYNWVAVYSGDANYPAATSPCGAPNEASVVNAADVTIVTQALTPVTLSQPIRDTATVTGAAGAPTPTGTVTFTLFGPSNPTCTGTPIFTSANRPLAGGPPPTATSEPTSPLTAVGTYNWVAVYSGDANNNSVTSPCGAPNEASVVTSVPTIDIEKTATPASLPEPGGDFTFDVVVTNTSIEVLTLTSLTDNVYGDLSNDAANPNISNSTCDTVIGTVLQPARPDTYTCSFTGNFTGNAATTETDMVTVTGTNPAGVTVTDTDDAVGHHHRCPAGHRHRQGGGPPHPARAGGRLHLQPRRHQPRHARGGDDHVAHRQRLRQPRRPGQPQRHQQHLPRR